MCKIKMSVQDRINQLLETKEVQDLLAEWRVSLVQLGPTPQERFRRLLTMNIDQMTAYSDPVVKRRCNDPEYMFREREEMDRILSGLPFLIGIDGTLNAGTLTKYAWLHEHCTDPNLKTKIKDTIDYLIQLGNRYVDNPPVLLIGK